MIHNDMKKHLDHRTCENDLGAVVQQKWKTSFIQYTKKAEQPGRKRNDSRN